jgi:Putative zinc-finger
MDHPSDSQLNEYLDRRLSSGARRAMEAHLATCESCRSRLDEFQFIFERLAKLPEARLPHDLAPDILARLPQKAGLWTPALAFQLALALGILLWLSSRAADFIELLRGPLPVFSGLTGFRFPQFPFSAIDRLLATFNLGPLTMNFLFTLPKFQFHPLNLVGFLPDFAFPPASFWIGQLSGLQTLPSSFPSTLIVVSVLVLWIVGNAALLWHHSEAGQ